MVADLVTEGSRNASRCQVPVFEPVRLRILRALESGRLTADVTALLACDPAATAELLTAANSPEFGCAFRVYTAQQAIEILGWSESESVVRDAFEIVTSSAPALVGTQWAHGLACAVIASELADVFRIAPDRGFAFGILHDIGTWGLLCTHPDSFLRLTQQGAGSSFEKLGAEECLMGINHCKAGAWLVKSWGLPLEFSAAAAKHHDIRNDPGAPAACLVAVACRWADSLGLTEGYSERVSVRDAIELAPPQMVQPLQSASADINRRAKARLLRYAQEFGPELVRVFSKL